MSHSAIERRRRAALAMVTRGLHETEDSAAQAMDRSLRTYHYIKASPEWLELRNRMRDKIQWYAWHEWLQAVELRQLDRAGRICQVFDLLGLRKQREYPDGAHIEDDWL